MTSARLRTIGLVIVAFFSLTAAVALSDNRAGAGTQALPMVGWLVGMALVVAMVWRHRWPLWFTLAASVASIALPIDGFMPLVGCYATVLVGDRVVSAIAGGAASLAVAVSIWRDSAGHTATPGHDDSTSLWRLDSNPTGAHFPIWFVLVLTAVLVGATFALALLGRSRQALQDSRTDITKAEETAAQATLQASRLGEELSRQQERDRIAQEVHDVLGHRLSLLSLHAGALEVAAQGDPQLADRARQVRESAQQSMGDLRSLLTVLRNPGESEQREPMRTLQDLPALIDECIQAGSPVASSIFVDQSEPLDPIVSHSIYRITQELLTNARKHSPGAPIRLHINGRPADGISIDTVNACRLAPGSPIRAGGGLTGLNERTTRCGGRSWVWVAEDGTFRCRAIVPWALPGSDRHVPTPAPRANPYPRAGAHT